MSSQPLRIAQVGAGGRGQDHLTAATTCEAVEVVALCDMDEAKARATAERFGIARVYTDMAAMIRDTQPELVNIVTPPHLRSSVVEPALDAGAPAVLIEKPIALTLKESRKLEELGRDRLIAVNTQFGWMPHWLELWPRLQKGELGVLRRLRASTGMDLLEQGPHVLGLALRAAEVAGLPSPEWVFASCQGRSPQFGDVPIPADTNAVFGLGQARLWFNAGQSAPPTISEPLPWLHMQVELEGDLGRFEVSWTGGWILQIGNEVTRGDANWDRHEDSQRAMLRDLRDALRNNTWRQFPTRIEAAARTSDALFACIGSAKRGVRVSLTEPLADNFPGAA